MWRIIAAIVGVVAAFGSTYSGVYFAAQNAEFDRIEEQKSKFNSLVRVMHNNCEHTLSVISKNAPTDKPTPLVMPTTTFIVTHANISTLGGVDEDRLTELVNALADLETSGRKYGAVAERYERPLKFVPEPPSSLSENATQLTKDQYARHKENWKQYTKDREAELVHAKNLYDEYKNTVRLTCDVFQETISVQ